MSQKLYFQDLEIGDLYIGFPVDGDDAGHGGYLGGSYLFEKTSPTLGIRQWDGAESTFNADGQSPVIKVIGSRKAYLAPLRIVRDEQPPDDRIAAAKISAVLFLVGAGLILDWLIYR